MSRITPLILATALFMENMDSTVIATSLAAIAIDIGTDPISLKLALTAYLVALAMFIPISSWMADRFGARNVFRMAMLVFVLGSIACAFADLAVRLCCGAVPAGHGRRADDPGGPTGAGALNPTT
ncbi:MFS transporter [Devosia sp. J2-20]|uniref:MFS transporter n=1 Tax=Devosia sp. J2-20 TaxID=3026161 RepID=UPI00249AA0FB|nr:MFS transporter [Devosia sp. J2-20]WDQ97968.1 MFS transporter [Devosia sp. J2-20]